MYFNFIILPSYFIISIVLFKNMGAECEIPRMRAGKEKYSEEDAFLLLTE